MDQNNNNRFDDVNVNVYRDADSKTKDFGARPCPLAPWANSSHLPYTPASHPPSPNPKGAVGACEAAQSAARSSNKRTRSPATLQRLRIHATRRSELAVPRRTASSSNVPASGSSLPAEGVTTEGPDPQLFESREAGVRLIGVGLQPFAAGTIHAGVVSLGEETCPDYLDGMVDWMVDWMRSYVRERNLDRSRCASSVVRAAAAMGIVVTPPRPCSLAFAPAQWPCNNERVRRPPMGNADAVLGMFLRSRPRVQRDRGQLRNKAVARRAMVQMLRDRHRRP
ncbi:hypothetical protein MMC26_002976 [Xylographa opegraphella]|nr:hypothetical protein [Xylographa opegraphella]